ncbi:gamma-glutamylcyclotransferase [Clostridia bacterium]|nr:gamma-glutamylcyclotransferase [Clostridia bacterium]
MENAKRRLYVAYGSNLNLAQMALRCPTAKVVGTATLRNWCLIFQGVGIIERHKGGEVSVLGWEIQLEDEIALDHYEGWPRMYRKESVRVRIDGKQVRAMVYIMNGERRLYAPSNGYYNTIREGYVSAGFDLSVLQEAVKISKNKEERFKWL